MGLFWQKAGFCTGPKLYVVVFCCRRRTLTGRLSSLTVYWCEHWPRRLLRTEWRGIMNQSRNVLYTYTKRFAYFAESLFLLTRRVFAESFFAESGAFLPSQLFLSQLFADEARYCWVSFAESDRQFIDVDFDRGGIWGTAWRWVMIQSANVLYTYTKRFTCFCWVSVFDDKVRFCRVSFSVRKRTIYV